MQRLLIILSFFTLSYSTTALLDFSDDDDSSKVERPIKQFLGLNPYNPLGIYTLSWKLERLVSNNVAIRSYLKKYESKQRDINFHAGTTFLFSGVGIHLKQYWNDSKYKPISLFYSYGLSLGLLLPMCSGNSENCEPQCADIHAISSGLDINVLRFNVFDLRLSAGFFALGSVSRLKGGISPFLHLALTY